MLYYTFLLKTQYTDRVCIILVAISCPIKNISIV